MADDLGEFRVHAKHIFPHEDYKIEANGVPRNDICLIQVESLSKRAPAECRNCFSTACFPQTPTIARPGRYCWIAGWGNTAAIDIIDPG